MKLGEEPPKRFGCWSYVGDWAGHFDDVPKHRLLMMGTLMEAWARTTADEKGLLNREGRKTFLQQVVFPEGISYDLVKQCASRGFDAVYAWTDAMWQDALKGEIPGKPEKEKAAV